MKERCPYTKSGTWPDKKLVGIIKSALESPNPKCSKCRIKGIVKGFGEVAWCECPRCGKHIGRSYIG